MVQMQRLGIDFSFDGFDLVFCFVCVKLCKFLQKFLCGVFAIFLQKFASEVFRKVV